MKWSKNCVLAAGKIADQKPSFQINDTKLYVPVVTLSIKENLKLLKQLESDFTDFKRTIDWNKYPAKTTNQTWKRYSDFLIDPSFQGVNRLFVLSFKDDDGRESRKQYYLPTVEKKRL